LRRRRRHVAVRRPLVPTYGTPNLPIPTTIPSQMGDGSRGDWGCGRGDGGEDDQKVKTVNHPYGARTSTTTENDGRRRRTSTDD
jgi:hypothetical protein